jgi:hypothetical protein
VHPSEQQQSTYIASVQAIDPKLVEREDQAVSHGRNICLDLFNDRKNNESTALDHEIARENVDTSTAKKIIEAAQTNLCPEPEFNPGA